MKSANFGAPGAAGAATGFLAQAPAASRTAIAITARLRARIECVLLEPLQQAARQFRLDGDRRVGGDVPEDVSQPVEIGDALAIGRILRIELEGDRRRVELQ